MTPLAGAAGRATGSLVESVRRAALTAAAGWQLVMALATFASLGLAGWPLMAAQLCLGAASLLAAWRSVPAPAIPIGMTLVALWGFLAGGDIDSTVVFASCWEMNFAGCVAGLLLLRRSTVPLIILMALASCTTMLLARPGWGFQFPIAVVVTQTSIIVAVRVGLAWLLRLANDADAEAAVVEDAKRRTEIARRKSVQLAEETRVLHDTAINTLGAIANGGAGVADQQQVRDQCARDVLLLSGLHGERPFVEHAGLRGMFEQQRLPVARTGLEDEALEHLEKMLTASVTGAVVGCVREAVTNAAKHSGADLVRIDATESDGRLVITVQDSGSGFAGPAPGGRGIESSIVRRAADNGFQAGVASSPGAGTTVTLTVALQPESAEWFRRPVGFLHHKTGELWGLGVTAVSVILTLGGGTDHYLALYPMIGVMALAWFASRSPRLRRTGLLLHALLIAATCAVFFLSAAATAFGQDGVVHWQALAPTGPFILLLSLRTGRNGPLWGAVAWAVLVTAMAVTIYPSSGAGGQILIIAACVGLGFSAVWARFQHLVEELSEEASRSQHLAFVANLRTELATAARLGYQRWLGAGLESAVQLLQEIADGGRPAHEPSTRERCGTEELYLRQLVQISPELVHLSRALMPTLKNARDHGVELALRLGGTDVADEEAAGAVAREVYRGISGTPPGGALTASLFPMGDSLQLTLIGPGVAPPEDPAGPSRYEQLGAVNLLELRYPQSPVMAG
ncbi:MULTISPECIES: ATP-binding protein [Arthrobacter]|uniref:ATP-binding protein n=2 Tax=Arthrobacter TaxID=1663 RepID=A0ABU9KHP7_9MICC|nr:ATP-binding protein [Arthrobacter sp. YJM1]MDP5226573.1 ATP-binding protein [Arthrobacter sp. YJM1]